VANIKSKADIKSLDLKFCLIKTGNKKYTNAPSSSHIIQQHTFHLLPVASAGTAAPLPTASFRTFPSAFFLNTPSIFFPLSSLHLLLPLNAAAVAVDHLRSGAVLYGLNLTDLLALKLILFMLFCL
jgi:hypothetical protein